MQALWRSSRRYFAPRVAILLAGRASPLPSQDQRHHRMKNFCRSAAHPAVPRLSRQALSTALHQTLLRGAVVVARGKRPCDRCNPTLTAVTMSDSSFKLLKRPFSANIQCDLFSVDQGVPDVLAALALIHSGRGPTFFKACALRVRVRNHNNPRPFLRPRWLCYGRI